MARNNLAAVEFRATAPRATLDSGDPGDALANVNVAELPDAALGLVQENGGEIFMLDLDADIAPVSGINADAMGGGMWLLFLGFTGEKLSCASQLNAAVDLATTANTWLSPSAADITFNLATGALFTLSATTGRLTYHGPNCQYRLELLCSVSNTAAAAAIRIAAAVSVNGDVSGTANVDWQQETTTTPTPQDVPNFICATREILLSDGDTIDPVFKNITDGTDIALNRMMLTATPAP